MTGFEIIVIILLLVICWLLWRLVKDNYWIEELLKQIRDRR